MSIGLVVLGAKGRMGRTVCNIAMADSKVALVGVVDLDENFAEADRWGCPIGVDIKEALGRVPNVKNTVIIDFTAPGSSLEAARVAARVGAGHVIGSTGFTEAERAELEELAKLTPIFLSSNMSIGLNAILQVLPELARALGEDYDVEIMEIHHNRKKDSPSGTALTLAESLSGARGLKLDECACYSREGLVGERPHNEIGVQALRGGDVVGVHTVYFLGPGERVEVTHHAHSRETFAQGALRAAKWLIRQKPGKLYSMKDMLLY